MNFLLFFFKSDCRRGKRSTPRITRQCECQIFTHFQSSIHVISPFITQYNKKRQHLIVAKYNPYDFWCASMLFPISFLHHCIHLWWQTVSSHLLIHLLESNSILSAAAQAATEHRFRACVGTDGIIFINWNSAPIC